MRALGPIATFSRVTRPALVKSCVAVALLAAGGALAQQCTYEVEPNDTPALATPVSGEGPNSGTRLADSDLPIACLAGDLTSGDQDAFAWVVDDLGATHEWVIGVEGAAGAVTQVDVFRVEFADDGESVAAADSLFRFGTADGAWAESGAFLLPPGSYVLGVSGAGGAGEYVVHLTPVGLRFESREHADGRSYEGEFDVHTVLGDGVELPFTVDEEGVGFAWTATLFSSLGSAPSLAIQGPDGLVAEDAVGSGGLVRLSNLGLTAGDHTLRVTPQEDAAAGTVVRVSMHRAGRFADGIEVEPNDWFDSATRLDLGSEVTGVLEGTDVFRVDVSAAQAASAWDLVLEATAEIQVRLFDAEETLFQDRFGVVGTSARLHLEEGHYYIQLTRGDDQGYSIALRERERAGEGSEREPNDRVESANDLGEELQVRGELARQDADVFVVRVSSAAQRFRIQAVGDGVEELELLDAGGSRLARVTGERRLRIDDVTLLPGPHYVRVSGEEGEYALRALPLGPAPDPDTAIETPPPGAALSAAAPAPATPDGDELDEPSPSAEPAPPPGLLELEPNDGRERANRLQPGVPHVGRLGSRDDRDFYRFHLATDQYVRLELLPAEGDMPIPIDLYGQRYGPVPGSDSGEVVAERWLLAGDYVVELRGSLVPDGVPTGYYQLRLTLLGPLHAPADFEPNDRPEEASPLPAELEWSGLVGEASTRDLYRLPEFSDDTRVSLELDAPDSVTVDVVTSDDTFRFARSEGEATDVTLPGGKQGYLRFSGRGRYDATLRFGAEIVGDQTVPRSAEGLAVDLLVDATELAAFWHEGQSVSGQVVVTNNRQAHTSVELAFGASDARVMVEGATELEVPAGESVTTPVSVIVPADMVDEAPLAIQVAAITTEDRVVAEQSVTLRCEARPLGAFQYWPLPPELLGRPNVLYSGFGAVPYGEGGSNRDIYVNDGRTAISRGGYVGSGHSPTFALGGEEPVTLVGTTLNPQSDASTERQLKGFSIETSLDGRAFETAFVGELVAARFEQAFVFDEPVTARYARLVFGSSQGGPEDAYIGEWRLIAADPTLLSEGDLTAQHLGGHHVWSRPLLNSRGQGMFAPGGRVERVDLRDHDSLTFVLGFHNGRAARVAALEWTDSVDAAERFERVAVAASTEGPAGPWTPVGEWDLTAAPGQIMRVELEEPVWARFLRFTAPRPDGLRYLYEPDEVSVIEAPVADGYLSALGEWGNMTARGPFEAAAGGGATPEEEPDADNDSMEEASRLDPGRSVSGSVAVAEDVDWYVFTVGEDENRLEVRLEGDPSIGYSYRLLDAEGENLPFDRREDGSAEVLSAFVEPGDYYLMLEEPKRTVVFAWDTSGSVAPYRPITYSSLAGFARDVDGAREAVQLMAFNDPSPLWLLPYWSSDTERVQRAIAEFDPRRADSSNAELALLTATRALEDREGTRAVLFMTDAESGGYSLSADLWAALEAVRPRVFTFEISSAGSDYSQDLMQDWAAVNAGVYDMTDGVGGFDAGFSRASCILRRPKRYTVEVTTGHQAPPGPGTLTVSQAEGAMTGAVEVIFDASGSMGQALPAGESRIDAAIRALETLIGEVLPDGAPFALRAFGHVAPSSCETRLDLPLSPLDREVALEVVRSIEPKLLSQTAIGDSLALVADDLADADGPRTVILITDGEESCGGDPASAAAGLRASGDVAIAIVSLALEPESLAVFEGLAEEIGASYVDVTSHEALTQAITEALVPAFEVYDIAGDLVATARVGETLELPMGLYSVRVLSSPIEVFEDVRVPGDGAVEVVAGTR